MGRVTTTLRTPLPADLPHLGAVLGGWQQDDGPVHLHPGDLGWFSMRGPAATAAAVRVWSRDGAVGAIGLLDGADLLRLAVDPDARDDEDLARRIADDVTDPAAGVLGDGAAVVEARGADTLSRHLHDRGWQADEPWTPLHLDLAAPVADAGLRVVTVGPDLVDEWWEVHRSAFRGTTVDDDERPGLRARWDAVTTGPFGASLRCLVARDARDRAVAVAGVWSAGPGRPGLVEPMGVHRDHRHHGYGTAVTRAAARTLRDLGASGAVVCAETTNAGAVATYVAAGFTARPAVSDLRRPA